MSSLVIQRYRCSGSHAQFIRVNSCKQLYRIRTYPNFERRAHRSVVENFTMNRSAKNSSQHLYIVTFVTRERTCSPKTLVPHSEATYVAVIKKQAFIEMRVLYFFVLISPVSQVSGITLGHDNALGAFPESQKQSTWTSSTTGSCSIGHWLHHYIIFGVS